MEISALSFNIHLNGRNKSDGSYYDLPNISKKLNADIMVFQEDFFYDEEGSRLNFPLEHQQLYQGIGTFKFDKKIQKNLKLNEKGTCNIVLSTKFKILNSQALVVKPYGGDPRTCSLLATLLTPTGPLQVLAVHLTTGWLPLGSFLQLLQLRKVIPREGKLLIIGDHNLWSPLVKLILPKNFSQLVKAKTWPGPKPRHQIDQAFLRGGRKIEGVALPVNGSDHLPIKVLFAI